MSARENASFLEKVNRAFPENGILSFPDPNNADVIELTKACRTFALTILDKVPHSRERSLSLTALEESFSRALEGLGRR